MGDSYGKFSYSKGLSNHGIKVLKKKKKKLAHKRIIEIFGCYISKLWSMREILSLGQKLSIPFRSCQFQLEHSRIWLGRNGNPLKFFSQSSGWFHPKIGHSGRNNRNSSFLARIDNNQSSSQEGIKEKVEGGREGENLVLAAHCTLRLHYLPHLLLAVRRLLIALFFFSIFFFFFFLSFCQVLIKGVLFGFSPLSNRVVPGT